MPVTVRNTDILFNNGTTQSSAGIAAQNCSYTGALIEIGPASANTDINFMPPSFTLDMGSNRVMTGVRKSGTPGTPYTAGVTTFFIRGHTIKNTA